ncbi:peptidoglycan-binding domain-containing protein, partial [Bradyrhizobium sp. 23AC]
RNQEVLNQAEVTLATLKTGGLMNPTQSSTSKKSFNLPSGIIKVTKPLTKGRWSKSIIDGYYSPKTENAVKRFQLTSFERPLLLH